MYLLFNKSSFELANLKTRVLQEGPKTFPFQHNSKICCGQHRNGLTRMPETSRFDCQDCQEPNNIDDMVQCEGCGKWSHYGCVGFDDGQKEENWKCSRCVTKSTSDGAVGDPSVQTNVGNQQLNRSTVGSGAIGELVRLNLELLEERKAFLLKEIELEQAAELERRKLQLEKEAWKARYEILNGRCETTGDEAATGGLGDWVNRLNQVAVSQNQLISAPASTVTVPIINSGTRLQHTAAGGVVPTPLTSLLPAVESFFGGEPVPVSQPSSTMAAQANLRQLYPPTSAYAVGQATSFMRDF